MDEYTDKELETLISEREYAEQHGLYDTMEKPDEQLPPLSESQEMALAQAMSTLSDLAKETNSSLSELIKRAGYNT